MRNNERIEKIVQLLLFAFYLFVGKYNVIKGYVKTQFSEHQTLL